MAKWRLFNAYMLGFKDGFESPAELSSGLTWSPSDSELSWSECFQMNESYDTGANHGQVVGGLIKGIRPQPWQDDVDD
jgi:hypothetical protein